MYYNTSYIQHTQWNDTRSVWLKVQKRYLQVETGNAIDRLLIQETSASAMRSVIGANSDNDDSLNENGSRKGKEKVFFFYLFFLLFFVFCILKSKHTVCID